LIRPALVIGAGLAMAAVGLAVLTQVGRSPDADLAILAGASLVISLGLAPVFTATTDLIVGSAPPERAGAASGISETGAELGGALGIAILGSIGVAIYRGRLVDLPAGIPAEAAATARETLGAAAGIATKLPAETGAALLVAAQDAFTFGLQLTAGLSAVVAAAMAVAATILLRAVPVTAQAEPAEQAPAPAEPAPTSFEDSFQLIRSGAGCVACPPGDRGHADAKAAEG
jgi:DHA2 family multidrug resistance protein-like MFS transporter